MTTPHPQKRRKQLVYRANHRGIRELDILLGEFATARLRDMGEADLHRFESLLEESDRDLLSWFTGEREPPDRVDREMMGVILAHRNGSPA